MAASTDSLYCSVCKSALRSRDKRVKCDGRCQNWHHISCVNLSTSEHQKILDLGCKIKWFCEVCDDGVTKFVSRFEDFEELFNLNSNLKSLFSRLDSVIIDNTLIHSKLDNLTKVNNRLCQKLDCQINDLDSCSNIPQVSTVIQPSPAISASASTEISLHHVEIPGISPTFPTANPAKTSKPSPRLAGSEERGTGPEKTSPLHLPSQRQSDVCLFTSKPPLTYAAASKKPSKPKPIIGKKLESSEESLGLRSVEPKLTLFISRIHPEVTEDKVKDYLVESGITQSEIECAKLNSRYNSYQSFKVALPRRLSDTVLQADFWPAGTLVREFINKRKPNSIQSRTFLGKSFK
jgi:hypothetical protein